MLFSFLKWIKRKEKKMKPLNKFFINALYDWVIESNGVPYIEVNVKALGVIIPPQFHEQDKIIFNISMDAAPNLNVSDDGVSFSARFGGKSEDIFLPLHSILSLFDNETKSGMQLPPMEPPVTEDPKQDKDDKPKDNPFSIVK
ncbi:MAG: hypothetical protein CL760_05385 [Chloroflexi bacterium]|nr:hypothetical protein [Chloroflexota bacterium]|tara:strand:- start:35768 stop:36196 length:429 start_codon:yes stop_codon:yes gene_type:complete